MNGEEAQIADQPKVAANVWPEQFDWLTERRKDRAGRISRSMSDVIREIIDDAMHAEEERRADA